MLAREGCLARRARLVESVDANLIIVTNPRHIQYFTGLYISPLALSAWGNNFLIIDPYQDNKATLLVHNFIAAEAQKAQVDEVIIWTWYDVAQNPGVPVFSHAMDELNIRLPVGGRGIAAEKGWLPWNTGVTEMTDITPTILQMRRQKDADELTLIREAVRVNAAGHAAGRAMIQPGVSELDVYNAIHAAMVQEAGHAVLLMGDFASGERANTLAGGPATSRTLAAGELMILDLFPVVNGYRADYTATVAVDGSLNDTQRRLENALHTALQDGEALLKPGSLARDVYQAVKNGLASIDPAFAAGFSHHAGHGLGLGHPEAPFFVPNSAEALLVGDVVTLEPGAYSAGGAFGARIEHNYLITETGFERLSSHNTTFGG